MRGLRRDIGAEADTVARSLTRAWVAAWDRHAGAWRTAAADLIAEAQRLDHWPRPTDIARLDTVMRSLDRAEATLGDLSDQTREAAVAAANRIIDLDTEREVQLIASQAPATEQEGLARHLAGRLPVAEEPT